MGGPGSGRQSTALAARLAPSALLSDKEQDVHQPRHTLTRWRGGFLKARRISNKGQGLIKVHAEPGALKAALQAYPAPAPIAHLKAHLDLVAHFESCIGIAKAHFDSLEVWHLEGKAHFEEEAGLHQGVDDHP